MTISILMTSVYLSSAFWQCRCRETDIPRRSVACIRSASSDRCICLHASGLAFIESAPIGFVYPIAGCAQFTFSHLGTELWDVLSCHTAAMAHDARTARQVGCVRFDLLMWSCLFLATEVSCCAVKILVGPSLVWNSELPQCFLQSHVESKLKHVSSLSRGWPSRKRR